MKTKITLFILTALLSLSIVNANALVMMPPIDTTPNNGQAGCMPPIDFSIEHNCRLESSSGYSINTYDCINGDTRYYVTGDCKGGVVSSSSNENFDAYLSKLFTMLAVAGAILIILYSIFKKYFEENGGN